MGTSSNISFGKSVGVSTFDRSLIVSVVFPPITFSSSKEAMFFFVAFANFCCSFACLFAAVAAFLEDAEVLSKDCA